MGDEKARSGNGYPTGLPANQEAEVATLGGALLSGEQADFVAQELDEDAFTASRHRLVFRSISRLRAADKPADVVMVAEDLRSHGELGTPGDRGKSTDPTKPTPLDLQALVEACPVVASVPSYVRILQDTARRRRLLLLTHQAEKGLAEPGSDPDAVMATLTQAMDFRPGRSRLVGGWSFATGGQNIGAVWGKDHEILWPEGEPLLIVAPTGAGKTTLAHRLVSTLLRLSGDGTLLGFPVREADRPILYIAADRPKQIQRSLWRFLQAAGAENFDGLDKMLHVWPGRLEFDISKEPDRLHAMARSLGAGTVILDSLKDAANPLTDPEVGQGVHHALSALVSSDIEVLALHHQRKATSDNRKPNTIDDVYGSSHITNGSGSVVLLWGRPGDPVLELSHLKPPAEEVGPFTIRIDHETGDVRMLEGRDVVDVLRASPAGLTSRQVAQAIYQTTDPTEADIERIRHKLRRKADRGLVLNRESAPGRPALWFPIVRSDGQGVLQP